MPFDRILSRKLVEGYQSHYSRAPNAEFIGKMAAQLQEALDASNTTATEFARARNDVTRLERELEEEREHYRKLREKSAHTEALVQFVRYAAKSPKGVAKKAAALLVEIGDAPVTAPEPVVAQEEPAL